MPDVFQVNGLDAFKKSLEEFIHVAERDVSEEIKNLAYRIAYNLVMETPQYSGAAASAWRVGLGSPDYITDKPYYAVPSAGPNVGDAPFSKRNRNMQAVNDALKACGFEIGMYTIKAGDIYIMNGLDYVGWFESGQHAQGKALRAENLPQRRVAETLAASLNISSVLRY